MFSIPHLARRGLAIPVFNFQPGPAAQFPNARFFTFCLRIRSKNAALHSEWRYQLLETPKKYAEKSSYFVVRLKRVGFLKVGFSVFFRMKRYDILRFRNML